MAGVRTARRVDSWRPPFKKDAAGFDAAKIPTLDFRLISARPISLRSFAYRRFGVSVGQMSHLRDVLASRQFFATHSNEEALWIALRANSTAGVVGELKRLANAGSEDAVDVLLNSIGYAGKPKVNGALEALADLDPAAYLRPMAKDKALTLAILGNRKAIDGLAAAVKEDCYAAILFLELVGSATGKTREAVLLASRGIYFGKMWRRSGDKEHITTSRRRTLEAFEALGNPFAYSVLSREPYRTAVR